MRIRRSLLVVLLFGIAFAGFVGPVSNTNSQSKQSASTALPASAFPTLDGPTTSCLFDYERGQVLDCVRQASDGNFFVSHQILKLLRFDSHGLASVLSANDGWMYLSRTGKVLIVGVPNMDNWADAFHDGLVRVVKNKKYGFANRKGQIVIAAKYDGAMNFEKRTATVCSRCETKCVNPDCEYHIFAGGDWFQINTKGIVVARLPTKN